eukprot:scaffold11367_cov142-Isochrysis_galbana.AAC.1
MPGTGARSTRRTPWGCNGSERGVPLARYHSWRCVTARRKDWSGKNAHRPGQNAGIMGCLRAIGTSPSRRACPRVAPRAFFAPPITSCKPKTDAASGAHSAQVRKL